MEAIGPGTVVELIDDRPCPDGSPCALTLGAHYTVEHVWDYLPFAGKDNDWMDCSVDLVGQPGPAPDLAWGLYRFKPVGGEPITVTRRVDQLEPA
jgi:hypothetical protein